MKGLYLHRRAPLHRLNPLIKLVAVLPAILLLTLVTDPWIPIAFIAVNGALMIVLGGISPLQYVRSGIPMLVISFGIALTYSLLASSRVTEGSPVWLTIGAVKLYEAGAAYGAATALRLFAMFGVTLVFVMTTDSSDLIRAMIQQCRLNDRFGYATLAVFRFIPDLRRELEAVQAAHRVRGMSGRGRNGSLPERVRRYMVPLLAAAIRRAERTAYAMDARGFGTTGTRTFFRNYAFALRDWLFLAAYWLTMAMLVAAVHQAGWMGRLSFLKLYD
ncbi:energy-coupling factor transporter transmembrane component T family protein [Paenibacillus contaminans]|uniref:Energy-coupling factor transporter transmembrane protein EcfT n=1 Tax=Paenibacillus contaminans TaxID=450362 RepID=A0A329MPZ6_9BACL|nr:energy-coupling factor transporter transmembrane component T [Paenibacillus contaminans]RAV21600.1 energy-coupling factor transporter transmembrane protein EcfT [Paenibacillus contaminans]